MPLGMRKGIRLSKTTLTLFALFPVAAFLRRWASEATHSSIGSNFLVDGFFTEEEHAGNRLASTFACPSDGFPKDLQRLLAFSLDLETLDLETYKH